MRQEHTDTRNHPLTVVYVVNARIPNNRAHSIQIVNTCSALAKGGCAVTLVTSTFAGGYAPLGERYGIRENFTHVHIPAIDIPFLPLRYAVRNVSFFISANLYVLGRFLAGHFRAGRAVVYVRGETILSLIPLMWLARIPVFFETHQIRNYEWAYRVALTLCRGVVVVTERLRQKLAQEYGVDPDKIAVARDGVDVRAFSGAPRDERLWSQYGIGAGKRVVLYSGTLAPEKGVETLAAAAPELPPGAVAAVLGGTDAQVVDFRAQHGQVPNLFVLGRVPYTEVPRHVKSADVLVLPDAATYTYSNLYTSPMKLFEYMASGVPIVASDVPSLREVLTDASARFFEPGNPAALAAAVADVLTDHESAAGRARRAAEDVAQFSWEERGRLIRAHLTARVRAPLRKP